MIRYKQLDNGVRLIVKNIQGLLSVSMGILVKTGAAVESDAEDGISHYIEHMTFKGTKKRTSFQISDDADKIGAQMNAYTSKDLTCYYIKSTSGHAEAAFEILADIFLNSTYPDDEAKKEKGVIIEEINMVEDTPDDLCLDLLSESFYGKRGFGRNILGSSENVLGFTKNDISAYRKKRYTTDGIVISMVGNIDLDYAENLCKKYFSCVPKSVREEREVAVEYKCGALFKKKEIEQIHIGLAYPSLKLEDKLFDATKVLNILLGGSMSSRLFQKVREELGLAYSVYSYMTAYEEVGALAIYAGVNAKNYLSSVEAVLDCIDDIKSEKITESEFERSREQLLSGNIFAQESTIAQMLLYGKELIYTGKIFDFEDRMNKISALTLSDVLDAVKVNFDKNYIASAVVGNVDAPLKI